MKENNKKIAEENSEEIDKLIELFQSPVKNIITNNIGTYIEFENGENIQLHGEQISLQNEISCSFCKLPINKPLFTLDDSVYICKCCIELAIKTFLKNGINLELEVEVKIDE